MSLDYSLYVLKGLARIFIPLGLIGQATDFTNVSYDSNGKTLHAYLAKPPGFDPTTKSYPVAVVLHAWNGMGEEPVYFSDLLAREGYVVIAPDLFRNIATFEANLPWNIATVLLTPQERMDQDIDAAISYVTHLDGIDSTRVFSGPGFCFGGSQAISLSIRRAMAGTITLYGANIDGLQDPNNNNLWGELGVGGTKVLGIYGADDGAPTPDEARGFQSALASRSIGNTVTIYDGVGHAFVNPTDHRAGKTQAVEAWDQVVAFMNDIVANGAGVSGRELELRAHVAPKNRPTLRWIWDHTMDLFRRRGHFHHHKHAASRQIGANALEAKVATLHGQTAHQHSDDRDQVEQRPLKAKEHVRRRAAPSGKDTIGP